MDYRSSDDTGSGISYYNFEQIENLSDRSQTSTPDNTVFKTTRSTCSNVGNLL